MVQWMRQRLLIQLRVFKLVKFEVISFVSVAFSVTRVYHLPSLLQGMS